MFDVKVRAKKKSAHKLNKKTTYMQEELDYFKTTKL